MRDFLLFIPLVIIYLAFKSTLLSGAPLPELTLLVVFYAAYTRDGAEGAVLAFIIGYIEDAFTGGVIGSSSFALVCVFLVVHVASRRMHFAAGPWVKAGGAAALSVVKGVLVFLVLDHAVLGLRPVGDIMLQAVITGIFAPALLAVLSRLTVLVRPRAFHEGTEA